MAHRTPPEPPATPARAESWSRYWATTVRHSCPGSFGEHYGPATQAFWNAQFAKLTARDHVVELGCGNGSLVRFMAESNASVPARLDLVDAAYIDHGWTARLPAGLAGAVHVHPGTTADRLPVAAARATAIFSQYALEYFWDEATWRELQRIMAPHATLAAVVHHQDSLPTRNARAEVSHCGWLLSAGGPMESMELMLPVAAAAATAEGRARLSRDPRASGLRASFNSVFAELERRAAAVPPGDVLMEFAEVAMRILQDCGSSGLAPADAAVRRLRQNVADHLLRARELVASALDRALLDAWRESLVKAGMRVEAGELSERGELFGWTLAASR